VPGQNCGEVSRQQTTASKSRQQLAQADMNRSEQTEVAQRKHDTMPRYRAKFAGTTSGYNAYYYYYYCCYYAVRLFAY
jgi:hypothetical protein